MRRNIIEKHQTLREKILETIRDAILKGALKPGEKVAEPELAERFGISRTPIRE
ncbi:MAG: GntR family transcriptional regulator, partial [Deltaproteobacteria bacterium]|nr:GntR family transcriptional regulator [Deltaproteobacteria bacterium]